MVELKSITGVTVKGCFASTLTEASMASLISNLKLCSRREGVDANGGVSDSDQTGSVTAEQQCQHRTIQGVEKGNCSLKPLMCAHLPAWKVGKKGLDCASLSSRSV